MTMTLPPIDVDLSALATRLDHVPERPLSLAECQTLKAVVHMFADVLRLLDEQGATIAQLRAFLGWARSEKMREVLRQAGLDPQTTSAPRVDESRPATGQARQHPDPGHGRHGAAAYAGAHKIAIAHAALHPGDACPGCATGKVYAQQEPRRLIRIVGQAPLAATVYALERLRCNLCGEVFTATPPEGVGPEKYDATSASMIALLKYGSGLPFHRLERLQAHLAIPLPASTQWEIVAETATVLRPTLDELLRQAAQGDVLHNDDTHMRVLGLRHEAAPAASGTEEAPIDPANAGSDMAKRTGVFTSGIVSQTQDGHRIALFFTGPAPRGRKLGRGVGAPGGGTRPADPDERCADAESARATAGDRGQLSRPRAAPVRRGHPAVPRPMSARPGGPRRNLRARRPRAGRGHDPGGAAPVPPGAQRPRDDGPARLADRAIGREAGGAQLGVGQGDHLSIEALACADAVSPPARGAAR